MSSRSVLVCKRILAADDPVLDRVERTYNDSFPEVERRDFSLVRQLIANEPDFQMYVFHREGQYVGFISGWSFDGFRYGEHFAIDPSQRNGGIGSEALKIYLAMSADPLVFEVELPDNELACRRIRFYERHGLLLDTTHQYIQPPYRPDGESIELRLMTRGDIDLNECFEEVCQTLHRRVYGVHAHA